MAFSVSLRGLAPCNAVLDKTSKSPEILRAARTSGSSQIGTVINTNFSHLLRTKVLGLSSSTLAHLQGVVDDDEKTLEDNVGDDLEHGE